MTPIRIAPTALGALLLVALANAGAQQPAAPSPATGAVAPPTASAQADKAEGEVRRLDIEGGRITLKHGEIRSLDMPPMTMVFVVKDKSVLDGLKVGDKVRFKASKESGKYTVTELEVVR